MATALATSETSVEIVAPADDRASRLAPLVGRRRVNHWAKYPSEEYVDYPRSKPLPYREECRLFRLAQSGDTPARNQLWVQNLRLVLAVANEFRMPERLLADAMQEGVIGLATAIRKFEVERYNSFSTYAWKWIYTHIQRFLMAHRCLAHVPGYMFPHNLRFRRELRTAGTPTGVRRVYDGWRTAARTPRQRRLYTRMLQVHVLSDPLPVHQLARSAHPEAQPDPPPDDTNWPAVVAESLRGLHDRERNIIVLRYGLGGEPAMTLEEIGNRYGLTRERLRQLQERAEAFLRSYLTRRRHCPFNDPADTDDDEY